MGKRGRPSLEAQLVTAINNAANKAVILTHIKGQLHALKDAALVIQAKMTMENDPGRKAGLREALRVVDGARIELMGQVKALTS